MDNVSPQMVNCLCLLELKWYNELFWCLQTQILLQSYYQNQKFMPLESSNWLFIFPLSPSCFPFEIVNMSLFGYFFSSLEVPSSVTLCFRSGFSRCIFFICGWDVMPVRTVNRLTHMLSHVYFIYCSTHCSPIHLQNHEGLQAPWTDFSTSKCDLKCDLKCDCIYKYTICSPRLVSIIFTCSLLPLLLCNNKISPHLSWPCAPFIWVHMHLTHRTEPMCVCLSVCVRERDSGNWGMFMFSCGIVLGRCHLNIWQT